LTTTLPHAITEDYKLCPDSKTSSERLLDMIFRSFLIFFYSASNCKVRVVVT